MSAEAWKLSTFRSHGFVNKTDNMGRVYIDLPINEAKRKLRALLAETAQQPNNTGMAVTPKSCECINSCVATIYICKDCGGRVNKK